MKTKTIKHPKLNNGREAKIQYPIRDEELDAQIDEIYNLEHYAYEKKEGGVYLDLGANVGLATLYFAQFAKQVYSVEPNPEIYKSLVENTKHLTNVKTFNVAWANQDTRNFLYGSLPGDQPQTLWERPEGRGVNPIVVDSVTPVSFFEKNKIPHIDVMKIDVEEAEYIIFPDDQFGEVSKKIDVIIGEGHYAIAGGFIEIIPELLKEWGYKTTFPKLERSNFVRSFEYKNLITGQNKKYKYGAETIFVAKKT